MVKKKSPEALYFGNFKIDSSFRPTSPGARDGMKSKMKKGGRGRATKVKP